MRALIGLGLGLLAASCAANAVDEESVQTSEQSLLSQEFTWTLGSPPTVMWAPSDGFCYLTRVTGTFRGGGERVFLSVANGRWNLQGTSGQDYIQGKARCINWVNFHVATGEQPTTGTVTFYPNWTTGPIGDQDSFCYLSGVKGDFGYGGGEWVQVRATASGWVQESGHLSGAGVASQAACVKLKNSKGAVIPFANGPRTAITERDDNLWAGEYLNSTSALQPKTAGICALAKMGGKFSGGGEYVQITDAGTEWDIAASSTKAKNGVTGTAQCAYY